MYKMLTDKISENKNSVMISVVVNDTLVAELNFESDDISYSEDGDIFIKYNGVDVTIPVDSADDILYDDIYETFDISFGEINVSVTF